MPFKSDLRGKNANPHTLIQQVGGGGKTVIKAEMHCGKAFQEVFQVNLPTQIANFPW